MPKSCKCILDKMVFKGAMTEKERDKILRNIKTDWIPVTERLPEEDGDYLVTKVDDENVTIIGLAYYSNGFGLVFYDNGWASNKTITAWMPLPKPYEEGVEG